MYFLQLLQQITTNGEAQNQRNQEAAGPKSRCQQGQAPSKVPGKNLFLAHPASEGSLCSLACGLISPPLPLGSHGLLLTSVCPYHKDTGDCIEGLSGLSLPGQSRISFHCKILNHTLKALIPQSYPTLCNPMDCSLPCSSVHGIPQARILEWVAILGQTWVSYIAGGFFAI